MVRGTQCPVPESNQRHEDFQSSALPTELTGQIHCLVSLQLFPKNVNSKINELLTLVSAKKAPAYKQVPLFVMPATGIEPVRILLRRILSPVRLPVPPRRRMDGGGFEPPKQVAADLQSVPFGHSGIHP